MKEISRLMPRIKETAARWQAEQRRKQEIAGELATAKVIGRVLDKESAEVKQDVILKLEDAGLHYGAAELHRLWGE